MSCVSERITESLRGVSQFPLPLRPHEASDCGPAVPVGSVLVVEALLLSTDEVCVGATVHGSSSSFSESSPGVSLVAMLPTDGLTSSRASKTREDHDDSLSVLAIASKLTR